MRYLDVCSGISASSIAWHPLGWSAAAFSEIESFPRSVLKHRFPEVRNYGDMTQYKEWPKDEIGTVDLLVGGTPCQSFSVAGLRKGMDDPRGNLALVFLGILECFKPRWVVWENVPGVLSSNKGRDFGAFLGGLAELGYGWSYRVLDAQFFGVPQRRRRVFVVGYSRELGQCTDSEAIQRRREFSFISAAVLFERQSVPGYPAPSRKTGEEIALPVGTRVDRGGSHRESEGNNLIAGTLSSRNSAGGGLGTDFDLAGGLQPFAFEQRSPDGVARVSGDVVATLNRMGGGQREPAVAYALNAKGGSGRLDAESETLITATLDANYGKLQGASGQDLNHGHSHLVTGFNSRQDPDSWLDRAGPVDSIPGTQAVATFDVRNITSKGNRSKVEAGTPAGTLHAHGQSSIGHGIRRLTPRECERLQGFPDDWTLVPHNGKPAKDGPRYKAIGNSMAVPVMRWIGERIELVEAIA